MPKQTQTQRPSARSAQPQGGGKVTRMFEEEEQRIEKKRKQGFMPFRFWLPKGEGCEVVILDSSLDDGFAIREHNLQGSDGKFGNYERCLADSGVECPICKKYGSDSYLVLLLSVIVKREWKSTKTGETHPYSKMLLPIKRGQFAKFRKMEGIAMKNHGTLRGVMFYMERGTDEMSTSIGEPVPLDNGAAFDFYNEDELVAEFGHKAVKNREGKVMKEANEDIKVYDYLKLFPETSEEELRDRHGVDPEPGSRADNSSASNKRDEEEASDDIPMAHSPSEIAKLADDGDDESIDKLVELAEEHGLNHEDEETYPSWGDLAKAIEEAQKPKQRTRPTRGSAKEETPAPRRRTRPSPNKADGGDVDGW